MFLRSLCFGFFGVLLLSVFSLLLVRAHMFVLTLVVRLPRRCPFSFCNSFLHVSRLSSCILACSLSLLPTFARVFSRPRTECLDLQSRASRSVRQRVFYAFPPSLPPLSPPPSPGTCQNTRPVTKSALVPTPNSPSLSSRLTSLHPPFPALLPPRLPPAVKIAPLLLDLFPVHFAHPPSPTHTCFPSHFAFSSVGRVEREIPPDGLEVGCRRGVRPDARRNDDGTGGLALRGYGEGVVRGETFPLRNERM